MKSLRSENEVVFFISHSDEINTFLGVVGWKEIKKLKEYEYCTQIMVKIIKLFVDGEWGYQVADIQILYA